MKQIDFIAALEFLKTSESGRKTPVYSGYRPHIEFENYPEYLTSGEQTYIGQEVVELGTKVKATIKLLATSYFSKRLYENMEFKFCEGARVIGFGKILQIINTELQCEEGIDQKEINLNLYPKDILERIKSDFRDNYSLAKRKIQEFIILDKTFRDYRIVRALLFTANQEISRLEKMIALAKIDWRDLLLQAEYNQIDKRVRDFNNEFGKEKL
ncbi:elongation factor Tu [Kordia periserrulae]|nr:elongation factor Tu [Kordia periserrulae]